MIRREDFEAVQKKIFSGRKPGEHFYLSLSAEDSQFVRLNAAKVRQIGCVEDASLEIMLVLETPQGLKRATRSCTLTGLSWKDGEEIDVALQALRSEVPQLPVDPYAELPVNHGPSNGIGEQTTKGELLKREDAVDVILKATGNLDLAGMYAAGSISRAMANTAGQSLWFSTEDYKFDFSLYTSSQRALKSGVAGRVWDQKKFENELAHGRERLSVLERPAKKVSRGAYRTYLAPAALDALVGMFSWGCISEAAIQQGDSPLRKMRSGEKKFSPLFNLNEDFSGGEMPRFNLLGEMAPEKLPLISKGLLKNTLVSSRSSKEYKLASNGAISQEAQRSPSVEAGVLEDDKILAALGTGLYLSNLHYLNWSDQNTGRVTGMTRYACFWVENAEIVAPIENLRWDDSLFSLLGDKLEALTHARSYQPQVSTYESRQLGGAWLPGALLSEMQFTL